MNGSYGRIAAIVVALAGLTGTAAADPASSADSAWSPLTESAGPPLSDPLEERGRNVFHQRCEACHGAIPDRTFGPQFMPPRPGTLALAARYKDTKPAVLDQRTDLTRELVAVVVRGGMNTMPFFRPTELSNDDLEALVAYLTRTRD